jgi:hypothetical protein
MTDIVEYGTIELLNQYFVSGKFKLDPQVAVGPDVYTKFETSPFTISEALDGKNPMVVYVNKDATDMLVFCWEATSRNGIQPSGCAILSEVEKYKTKPKVINELDDGKITIRPDQLVGDLVRVVFTSLTSPKELQGKIDTGATVSSLHSDRYTVKGQNIEFECRPLTDHVITVPLKTQHAVKSPDGGTVYRPVVELDVKVNGKLIKGAMFNLNDRSHMDQPVLIGQNVLQAGKFFVDPSRTEGVESEFDWEILNETSRIIPTQNANDEALSAFYQNMLESDITFNDLVRYIKREVIKTFEDIE